MKKLIAIILALVLALGLLAGCGNNEAPSTGAPSTGTPSTGEPGSELPKLKIGVILTSTSNGYGLTCQSHLNALGEALNVEFMYAGTQEVEEVTSAIENFIAAGCTGILNGVTFAPANEAKLCAESGVYYSIFSQAMTEAQIAELDGNEYYIGAIGNDDADSTYSMLKLLAETKGVKDVAYMSLPDGTSNMHDGRHAGVTKAAQEGIVNLVVEALAYNLTESSQNLVAQYPDIDLILAGAGGIEESMQPIITAGKAGQILFAGFREEAGAEDLFDDGTLVALGVGTSINPVYAFINMYNQLTVGKTLQPAQGKLNYAIPTVYVTNREEYLLYVATNMDSEPYSVDTIKEYLLSFNPNATYDDLLALMQGYTLENMANW